MIDTKKYVFTFIALTFVAYFLFYKYMKQETERAFEDYTLDGPAWNDEKVIKAMEEAVVQWSQAIQSLQNHDRETAAKLYRQGREAIATYHDRFGNREVESGTSLRGWKEGQDKIFLEVLMSELTWVAEKLKTGQLPVEEAENFVRTYNDRVFSPLAKEYTKLKPIIEMARAPLAKQWFRVSILAPASSEYNQLVRSALEKNWNTQSRFELRFGSSIGRLESTATWKKLTVRVNEETANYSFEHNEFKRRAPPSIPESVNVSFQIEGTKEVPTSWDNLSLMEAKTPVPETLWVKEKVGKSPDKADRLKEKNRRLLIDAIKEGFASLPDFELFPGQPHDNLTILNSSGRFDERTARVLAYVAPDEFVGQVDEAIGAKSLIVWGALQSLLIEGNHEQFADWITNSLPRASTSSQRRILEALAMNPWYGDYEPILEFIRVTNPDFKSKALRALRGHLVDDTLRLELTKIATNPREPNRPQIAEFILSQTPEEKLDDYLGWVLDRDVAVARETVLSLQGRAPNLARKAVLEHYDSANPKIREAMLRKYTFDRDEISEKEIAILREGVLQTGHPKLRENALGSLIKSSHRPEPWHALLQIKRVGLPPEYQIKIESELVDEIKDVKPDEAQAYLIEVLRDLQNKSSDQLSRGERSLKRSTITELLSLKDERTSIIRRLHEVSNTYSADQDLLLVILRTLYHRRNSREGWNWEQPELVNLIEVGAKHKNSHVREFAHKLAKFAESKGITRYREVLSKAPASS